MVVASGWWERCQNAPYEPLCRRSLSGALWSCCFALGGLLLAHHGLLAALGLLKACHEAGFLLGLGGVGAQTGANLLVVDAGAEYVGLHDGDEQRQEVVVAQARGVVVEMKRNITGMRYIIHFIEGIPCDEGWFCMLMRE